MVRSFTIQYDDLSAYSFLSRVVLVEITPVEIRSRAFSLFMAVSYIANIFVAVYTLSAINLLGTGKHREKNGIAKLYLILAGVTFVSWIYMFIKVPKDTAVEPAENLKTESKSKNGEEIF